MPSRLAVVGAAFAVLVALVLIYGDDLWGVGPPRHAGSSPCECLTGVFADNALLGALHRKSLFVGLHWRATPAYVAAFLDPWQAKYVNCVSFHKLELPDAHNDTAAVELLRRRLEEDAANDVPGGWRIRDRGLMASAQRRRERRRAPASAAEPTCHVWILPETARLPSVVWVALKGLLQEGTLADTPVRLSASDAALSRRQPLGVLLWADPADREALKHVVSPRTVMMFTTIRQ
ncbi:uncharacterized protein Tco025E_08189 [Trypanosoma conorhini]|uniref:Uncharacterized protein n=1 Tax=Trypanosoma conorhini TaxID=83891 RepID=A0A422ND31_9TRYP|nr:uncharacterized protein Tco025E_08189 [Trypanosoma conorhini]RNF03385.1 hypothetical protein Tco025E_08189 [Trypanosoma conorhini]